jgi:hypothetical protein
VDHPLTYNKLKMKVVNITEAKVTPFLDGIPGNNWWY